MDTPEFVVWAFEYSCPVRGLEDGNDPERTERQLRAARAVSDARREGRCLEGLCVDPPHGFRIDEALAIYGGLGAVEQACVGCPANAVPAQDSQALAGCFGLIVLPGDEASIHRATDRVIDREGLGAAVERDFLPTQPRWYGLWANPICEDERLATLANIVSGLIECCSATCWGLNEFLAALAAARARRMTLYAAIYPHGDVEGRRWLLVPHCPRCKAPWLEHAARQCAVCHYVGRPAPDKKRNARGRRPYYPLSRLLGPEQAAAFLTRYEVYRGLPRSQDRHQNQPQPGPSGSLQGG